jgi:hypothetical protein
MSGVFYSATNEDRRTLKDPLSEQKMVKWVLWFVYLAETTFMAWVIPEVTRWHHTNDSYFFAWFSLGLFAANVFLFITVCIQGCRLGADRDLSATVTGNALNPILTKSGIAVAYWIFLGLWVYHDERRLRNNDLDYAAFQLRWEGDTQPANLNIPHLISFFASMIMFVNYWLAVTYWMSEKIWLIVPTLLVNSKTT